MTLEQYKTECKELERKYLIERNILMKKCVDENNPYKIGDIITDHTATIRIEKIGYSYGFNGNLPCATYEGIELKKDGSDNKRGKKTTIWQQNIIKN